MALKKPAAETEVELASKKTKPEVRKCECTDDHGVSVRDGTFCRKCGLGK